MKFNGAIVTESNFVVNIDNKAYSVNKEHPRYQDLKQCFKNGDADEFVRLYDIEESIKIYRGEKTGIEIVNDEVYYNGELLHNSVVNAIPRMLAEGFDINPMVKFLEELMENPSLRSINELYNFLEIMGLTITEDGCFLAYKTVRSDYMDKFSGKINNKPGGKIPRLNRNQVDDDYHNACSHGYHVGALDYAGPGGWYNNPNDKVVICKVNPRDVVSVPSDHSFQKLRCCYYEVVGEYTGTMKASVYSGKIGDNYSKEVEKDFNEEVDLDELTEGHAYTANYTNKDSITKKRYFIVDEISWDEQGYPIAMVVELIEPEIYFGEYRTFSTDRLFDIYEFDLGCLNVDNDYDNWI